MENPTILLLFLLLSTENEQRLSAARMRGQTLLSEHLGTTDGSAGNVSGEQKLPLPGQSPHAVGSAFKHRGCAGCRLVVCRGLGPLHDGTGRDEQTRERRARVLAAGR